MTPARPLPRAVTRAAFVAPLLAGRLGVAAPVPPVPTTPTLTVTASEYAFAAPDTVAAGRTRVRMVNTGREAHILEIARLDGGHAPAEFLARVAARQPAPGWATFVGGPVAPAPGAAHEVTLDLAPGRYVLFCPIPSPADHVSHMVKGMTHTLIVMPPTAPPPTAPPPTAPPHGAKPGPVRVVLDDYGFALAPALGAGHHTLRVENRAAQPHEVVVFRLAPGRRAADVVRWARSLVGPPPGAVVGGTTALTRGQVASFAVDLTPGAYALLCFLSDATDGRSHAAHGMVRELRVR